MTNPDLTVVAADDWTMLRAIARRVLCLHHVPFRHPSNDQHWEVERSALRLSGYLTTGEMAITIQVPLDPAEGSEIWISFDDGLEPIVVPLTELDFSLAPAPAPRHL